MSDELSVNISQTLPSTIRCGFPSFLEVYDSFKQRTPVAPVMSCYRKLNKKCILLLKNLVNEQKVYRFDNGMRYNNFTKAEMTQFKFFLNTIEILCHDLGIINLSNYLYRTQNYGKYETHLDGLLIRRVEKGSIVTSQTYHSVLQNTLVSRFQNKVFSTKNQDENQEVLAVYNNCSYQASRYSMNLRNIIKELGKLNQIILQVQQDVGSEPNKLDSLFYMEGLWNPVSKVFHEYQIMNTLKAFENSIRDFEKALVQLAISLTDALQKEQASENPHKKLQISSPSALYPFSGMKSFIINDEEKRLFDFTSAKAARDGSSRILPSSGVLKNKLTSSGSIGPRVALSDLSIGKMNSVKSPIGEQKLVLNKCLQKELGIESIVKFAAESLDPEPENEESNKVELTCLISDFKGSKASKTEFCHDDFTVKKDVNIVSNLGSKFDRFGKFRTNNIRFSFSPDQENILPSAKGFRGQEILKAKEHRRVSHGGYLTNMINNLDTKTVSRGTTQAVKNKFDQIKTKKKSFGGANILKLR